MTTKNDKYFGIAAKYNLLSIVLILATSLGISFFMIRLEISGYYAELLTHGKTIADTTAKNCEYGLYTEDKPSLLSVVEGLSSDSDIAYVAILTKDGRQLVSRVFQATAGMPASPFDNTPLAETAVHTDFIQAQNGRRYLEILHPVGGNLGGVSDELLQNVTVRQQPKIIGYLRLGLTQDRLNHRIHQLLTSALFVTTSIVFFGGILMVIMSKRITSPLRELKAAIRDIAEGKFDTPLDIRTHDEIADLAGSFNDMRYRLREYHHKVEERTAALTTTNEQMLQEIAARKAAEEQLKQAALYDTLTGLPNRALFMDRLTHTIMMAKRREDYLYAVLFFDVDRFKVVNDSLGHSAGDQLLIAIGKRLLTCLRPGDTVARLGGDEFSILLEDISGTGNAIFIAERIGNALAAPFMVNGHEVFSTGSIGIALCAAGYEFPDEVLRDADTAMYRAKASSKDKYAVFEPGMHAHAIERLHLETDLRRAIERHEFVVFYQPIISLKTNRLYGYEALVRWQHPERGFLESKDFIQMAEETGMIVSIDKQVLRESCRQMQAWLSQLQGDGPEVISVNLSNKQMVQPDLVEYISRVLQDTGLNPSRLKLEITESVIIKNPEDTIKMLTRLKALGVQLYIDDFGTGYSSLSYLHRLPIAGLKIDRSFIKRLGRNGENQEIVKTILLLARDMNIEVVAEGVETASQFEQIKAMNCEYGQGYLFSKAMDSNAARALFESSAVRMQCLSE
jgi:diguanylate cyclase (GGDEF)-like protein